MKQYLLTVAFLLLAGLLIVGCTGGPDTLADDSQNTQADSQAGNSPDAENPEDMQTDESADESVTGSGGDASEDLMQILSGTPEYTVDYTMNVAGQTTETTLAMDLPRFASKTSVAGSESHSIYQDDTITVCTNAQGTWQCFEQALDPADQPANVQMEEDIESGDVAVVKTGTCTRAGETGISYTVTGDAGESSVCYTSDGILLEMTTPQSEMYATSVSRSVDESMFVAPAEPQDMAAMIPEGMMPEGYQMPQ